MHLRAYSFLALPVALTLLVPGRIAARDDELAAQSLQDPIVLHGRLIDGSGAPPLEDAVVVIRGERIDCVGARGTCAEPAGARVIDAGDGTILPGLIDLHTHIYSRSTLAMFPAAGVTAVRELHNSFIVLGTLESAPPPRPHIVKAGPLIDGELRLPGSLVAATPEQARAAVDSVVRGGADFVKLYNGLSPAAYRAAAERAAELGVEATTDLLNSEVDALQALAWGVRGFEHAAGFLAAYIRLGGDTTRADPDPVILDSLVTAVLAANAYIVPTLIIQRQLASPTEPSLQGVPLAERVDPFIRGFWRRWAEIPPETRTRFARHARFSAALVLRLVARGGRAGAGTDVPNPFVTPGGALHQELELLVEAGLAPVQAIHAATGAAASILNRDDIGTIEPGHIADIIMVDGNPATDIRATRGLRLVIREGIPYTMDTLLARTPPAGPGR